MRSTKRKNGVATENARDHYQLSSTWREFLTGYLVVDVSYLPKLLKSLLIHLRFDKRPIIQPAVRKGNELV